jgi:two-component system sensor kinase FixL
MLLKTDDLGNLAMEQTIDDAASVPRWAAPIGWGPRSPWKAAALSIAYIALYLTLDRLSFIGALHGVGITPWNPSTGVAIALLIIKGPHYAPLVMAAELVSGAALPMTAVPLPPVFLGALMVTAGYTGAAAILRRAGFQAGIRRSSDVVLLLIVTIISSGLVAIGFVASYAFADIVPWSGFGEAAFQFWIGDAIGIVSLLPPLLLLNERIKDLALRGRGRSPLQLIEGAAQAASIGGALAAVFWGMGGDHPLGLFYLLFLPLIWIATRHGLYGASWSVLAIQIGLIVGLDIQGHPEAVLRAFQLLMFALAATGLMLGAVVTERRRLLLALVDSEEHRAAILNTVPDGVLMIDPQGNIQSINPAVERLFSRPSHLLVGHDIAELVEGGPDLLDRLKLAARSPASALACWELDAWRVDGSKFPIELSAGRFDLLSVEHYTVVIRDITSRRNAEVRFREHQAELAHVSRVSLAGEMAAGIAHELSQPLTAVTAYARGCLRLLTESVSEPAVLQEGIQEVVQQAERAGDVLDRLREFVRGGEYRRAATRVEVLIDAVLGLTRVEAMQRGVEIEKRIDPNLPSALTDRVQIEQVLVNLLRNAMDAMDTADSPRRSIVISAQRNGGHAVEISVADSGPGVATEVTNTIFEPFVTTKSNGMGMGLSISRSIVDSHGGRLRMAHGVPSGAMFIFDLPTAEVETSNHAG